MKVLWISLSIKYTPMNIARIHLKISEHMWKSELYFSYPYGIFFRIREFQGKSEEASPPLRLCLCVANDIFGRRKKISKPGLNRVNTLLRVRVVEVSRKSIDTKPFPDISYQVRRTKEITFKQCETSSYCYKWRHVRSSFTTRISDEWATDAESASPVLQIFYGFFWHPGYKKEKK